MQGLTPRERQIVKLLAQGKTQNQIAYVLKIAPGTVYNHMRTVRLKTQCSTGEIVARAMIEGNSA